MSFDFNPHGAPHPWLPRRYQPIINRESAYAVLRNADEGEWQACVRWWDGYDQKIGWATPANRADRAAHDCLVEAVNGLKRSHSGQRGGGFRINEFGQVIVPTGSGGAGSVYCVGVVEGSMSFEDPDGEVFDLSDDGASPGADWSRPVVALRYTIHADDKVSFENSPDATTRERMYLGSPQSALGATARAIRGQAGFALFVNDRAAAVVKCPPHWQAKYVGQIDLGNWFEKEVCN